MEISLTKMLSRLASFWYFPLIILLWLRPVDEESASEGKLLGAPGNAYHCDRDKGKVAASPCVYRLILNGLDLGLDEQTGSLVYLSSPATGMILKASAERAGLIDMAYPVDSFLPMRLASRFSRASLIKETNGVTIRWAQLGPSRSKSALPPGEVSAEVTLRAAPDNKSVILTCRIENRSSAPIPQVMFPDFWGLKPFDGVKRTQLRLARGVVQPFLQPLQPPGSATFYASLGWNEYPAQGYYAPNALRWVDYGSWKGGLSVFQKKWATGNIPKVFTCRSEADPMSLRLLWEHKMTIEPGQNWESGEFWLTPHSGGWAKGIEVYRDYVEQVNPPRPLPKHVRDGLGFQTIFMAELDDPDSDRVGFRYKDLPRVAQDARQYGIDEIVPWFWCTYLTLPIPLRAELGTLQDFLDGVQQARQLGVNVAPFVSVHLLNSRLAEHYGGKGEHSNYSYHTELIPRFSPYYVKFPDSDGIYVDTGNQRWQEDALAAFKEWIDRGITSFSFDVFQWKQAEGKVPDLIALAEKVRNLARVQDAESTFSGESLTPAGGFEWDGSVLDYTWNWVDYVDADPLLNVLRSPRLNCNVENSPLVVKKAFCDGLYLNVMPKKPDRPNGTKLNSEEPALATALKEVAHLRKQFLPFFVEGTFIGDSVLSQQAPAFVRGYQWGGRLLIILLNDALHAQRVVVRSELNLWLPTARTYKIKSYNSGGRLTWTSRGQISPRLRITRLLQPLELALFEIETP